MAVWERKLETTPLLFSKLRVARKGALESHERLSLLELLASYIAMNGGCRFTTGIPDAASGGRITIQLDRWHKALVALSALAVCEPLVASSVTQAPMTDSFRSLGLPRQPLWVIDLLIPNSGDVAALVSGIRDQVPSLSGQETKGSELWRRLTIGTAESQVDSQLGLLPKAPLPWLPPMRIRSQVYGSLGQ